MDALPAYHYECLAEAAQEYSLPTRLVLAIYLTEGGKLGMKKPNSNGTIDHGPFQINTVWLTDFQSKFDFDISPEDMVDDFCLSARAASFIIRYHINAVNGDFWRGVGNYHSKTPSLNKAYSQRVYANSTRF